MTDPAPMTNRPETIEDFRYPWEAKPVKIMGRPDYRDRPDLARWWGNALAGAMDVPGLTVDKNGDIVRQLTDEELADKLAAEQRDYDRGRELYAEHLSTGEIPEHWFMWSDYLAYEGLETPRRPETEDNE